MRDAVRSPVHRFRTTTATLLCVIAAIARTSSAQAPSLRSISPAQTSTSISAEDLRQRLTIIAADSMEGREAGKRGATRAAEYLVAELKRLRVPPPGAPRG